MKKEIFYLTIGILLTRTCAIGQSADSLSHQTGIVSSRFIDKIGTRTAKFDQSLTRQTTKYLGRLSHLEDRMKEKLQQANPGAAKQLPAGNYQQWVSRLQDSTSGSAPGKTYIARLDTLQTTLKFLQSGPAAPAAASISSTRLSSVSGQVQQLQAHIDQSALISQYISERKQQISQYLTQYTHLPASVAQTFNQYKATAYYYRQQVEELKKSLSDPQKIEQQAITQLSKLSAYQSFLAQHSMLASMFRLPAGYEDGSAVQGLQTKDQVQKVLQQQASSGGQGSAAAIDQQMQQAKSQLTNMQSNLSKYGVGGQAIDMPNFQPNQQKTKTFLKRLTYGTLLQLSKSSTYFPATGNVGLTLGYKINDKSTIGIGASYNIGLGQDWGHMHFSSQGMGLTSYMDWKIKKTYYVTGGYELSYMTQFNSIAQLKNRSLWQPSALIGLEKKYKVSSKLQGTLQVLFDALYRQELPAGQMIKFRIGYNF
jgi:hypothetical protein